VPRTRAYGGAREIAAIVAHLVGQARLRRRAQSQLPVEVRQRLLDAIYAGQPFRTILRDLGLRPNQVWGLTKTDNQRADALETALTATRRDDLKPGTTAAYIRGCVCKEFGSTSMSGWQGPLTPLDSGRGLLRAGDHLIVIQRSRDGTAQKCLRQSRPLCATVWKIDTVKLRSGSRPAGHSSG